MKRSSTSDKYDKDNLNDIKVDEEGEGDGGEELE